MNLDEYRAMKAASAETPVVEQTPVTPTVPEPSTPATPTPEVVVLTEPKPEVFVVDGEELTPAQIKEFKAGYLRTQDYTKKTQEAAQIRREAQTALEVMNRVKQSPELVTQLGITLPSANDARAEQLEHQLVEREVELLTIKYPDFNVQEALELASSRPGLNLEDAYHITKSKKPQVSSTSPTVETPQFDIEEFKKQVMLDLQKDFEKNQTATQSIITSNDGAVPTASATPQLNDAEKDYCRKARISEENYIKMKSNMKR